MVDNVADLSAFVGVAAACAAMGVAWMGSLVQSEIRCGGPMAPPRCEQLATGESVAMGLSVAALLAFVVMFAAAYHQKSEDGEPVSADSA